jgi:class 3 adenylate cyclase
MPASPVTRRLAAILAADVAGYSRMVAENQEATLRTLGTYRAVIANLTAEHGGRIFGTAGDSVVAEFASAVQAVRAAVAIQRALQRQNADLPEERRLEFRIGINLGDVVAEGGDLLGDGVNIAARLQEVAAPAGICLSSAVREQIEGKLDFPLTALGERTLKNIPRPVATYQVDWDVEVPTAAIRKARIGPCPRRARPALAARANRTARTLVGCVGQGALVLRSLVEAIASRGGRQSPWLRHAGSAKGAGDGQNQ